VAQLLATNQWALVRDIAELVGELRIEDAVPALGKLLGHYEPRARVAAVGALANMGTPAAVDLLRRQLIEGTRETRILVAGGIGGPHARALAMPLLSLVEHEVDAEVQAEYYLALGRISSPEAVAALVAAAQPGGRLFNRRPAAPRIAAVAGLKAAGVPAARRALEALRDDADRDVREAVSRALSVLVGRAGVRAP
jgi:HEAT repeat protein